MEVESRTKNYLFNNCTPNNWQFNHCTLVTSLSSFRGCYSITILEDTIYT